MGKNTLIEWTATPNADGTLTPGHTWNPWHGCRKVSAGCQNCYMYRDKKRFGSDPEKVVRSTVPTFTLPLRIKEPSRIFVCSWSDFFIEDADEWRDEAWEIMRRTPHLIFLILTKRPENIIDRLPEGWPWSNIWLGVTAENQEMADKRIPILLQIPAVVRFVSVEPCLSPIDLSLYLGYSIQKGETGHEQRRNSIRISEDGRMENNRSGGDMEPQGEAGRTANSPGLFSGKKNGQRDQDSCGGASPHLSAFQREDPARVDHKSHQREEGGQSPAEFGSCNPFGQPETCFQVGVNEPGRSEKSQQQTNRCRNRGDSPEVCSGGDNSSNTCDRIQSNFPDHIKSGSRGFSQESSRENCRLFKPANGAFQKKKPEGPIHLIICGGESGPNARPMEEKWAADLLDQCRAAGAAYFMKQLDGRKAIPEHLYIREFPNV